MMFPDSGLVVGPSHSDGGVYASVANGPDVELEGGEFIINKEATEDFLPLIKQINDIGRMEQMNNANNAQNAHSAIDALIASASTQMMPGGGMVAPKTPMYQEGGTVADRTRVAQTFIPTESLNLPLANLAVPRESGSISRAPMTNEEIMQMVMDIATPGAVIGSVGKKAVLRAVKKIPTGKSAKQQKELTEELSKMNPDEIGYNDLQFLQNRLKQNVENIGKENVQAINAIERELVKKGKTYPAYRATKDRSELEAIDIEGNILQSKQQGGMIQYQEGGPLHSRRMFNQGTGFNKKKSDLNKDGKISEYEKKRGMAIAKSMKNQMQMGGMTGMQQPMMQRPMNPAMNLSPMQRMGNNMPPMMYQKGGSILPSQNTLRDIRRDAMSVLDNVGIENLRQAAMDTLMKMDMRPQEERSLFGSGQPVGMRVPQTYGPPAPRKQKEMRQKSSDLDELLKGLVIEVNPFTGDTITEQSIKEELERIRRRVEQSKKPNMQEGGMISDGNLMGAMANDRRVAALQPDVYSSRVQNGMTGAEAMVVPKLAEAILPAYGVETPLSRKQGAMLNKNAVSPSALNPNLKGLVNRLLVQRLANETT